MQHSHAVNKWVLLDSYLKNSKLERRLPKNTFETIKYTVTAQPAAKQQFANTTNPELFLGRLTRRPPSSNRDNSAGQDCNSKKKTSKTPEKESYLFQADWQNKSLAAQWGLSLLINVLSKRVKPCEHQNEFGSKVYQSGWGRRCMMWLVSISIRVALKRFPQSTSATGKIRICKEQFLDERPSV